MNILIISEIEDYIKATKRHFSFTKGFGIATGFSKLANTFYLTTGEESIKDNVQLINIKNITNEFIDNLSLILLIREHNIYQVLETLPYLYQTMMNKNRKCIIGIKSDAINYIFSKDYINNFIKKYDIPWLDFLVDAFDFICVQTKEYKLQGLALIKAKRPNYLHKFLNKIFVSRMGIFPNYPINDKLENPYDINHSYCVDDFTKINSGKALHPLCYTARNINYGPLKGKNYNTEKTILIYMGRIRTDNGNIAFMMRDIMNKLDESYELHIFPGRFNIPNTNVSVYSPKYPSNLQLLRDIVFHSCKNVIIHYPFDDITKQKYLQFAHIGIDFSSTRPNNRICCAGNAKLLEYCNYGIKVVSEKNVNNSHLVETAKNGILLNNLGTVDEYVDAIKKLKSMEYDKKYSIDITIKNQNWDVIANEMFDYVNTLLSTKMSK